ncbi:ABC transporter substrate-binding protein [Herbidospora yilanensis]|uniref:ABC transporter substrate-binding protein n=1 Tax=Herbidospora yilanensis TaxID=354426 RepID=UPI000A026AB9|nr:ABC transporter substrate-binding protein [Herbidospora yilanensis]
MKVRTRAVAATLAMVTLTALTACGSSDTPASSGSSPAGQNSGALEISLLTTYNGLPFYTAMQCGAQDAAKELGDITVTADGPARGMNAADQTPVLEGVVNRRPDGMIFVPADPAAMVAPIKLAVDAGIKVVTTDATLNEQVAKAQFRGDNNAGGALAAQEMVKRAQGQRGKVLVLDNRPGLPVTNQRAEGFIKALQESGTGLQLLDTQYYEDDPTKAATIVQSSLGANPDIVGIFATSESGAMGAVSGLQGAKVDNDKMTVIAYDAGPTLVTALRAGTLDALVAQGSYTQGYDALTRLVQEIRGQVPQGAAFDNVVANTIVTSDNVDSPETKKLLYPTTCS